MVTLAAVILAASVAYFIYSVFTTISNKGSPVLVAGSLPLFGHTLSILKDPWAFFANVRENYGPLCAISMMNRKVVILQSRELVSQLYKTSEQAVSQRAALNLLNINTTLFGVGREEMDHTNVAAIRKAVPLNYDKIIQDEIKAAIEALPQQGSADAFLLSRKFVISITMKAFLGEDLPPAVGEEIILFEKAVGDAVGASFFLPRWLVLPLLLPRVEKVRAKMLEQIMPLVAKWRNSDQNTVYVTYLLTHVDQHLGRPLNDHEISICVSITLWAAVSNTANGVAQLILHVAQKPHLIPTILKEAKTDGALRSPLVHACVLETARLNTTFFGSTRMVVGPDVSYDGQHIPPGTMVAVSACGLASDPVTFEEPLQFNPERFEGQKDAGASNMITTWGGGIHLCPGKVFAINEMKHALVLCCTLLNMSVPELDKLKLDYSQGGSAMVGRITNKDLVFSKK